MIFMLGRDTYDTITVETWLESFATPTDGGLALEKGGRDRTLKGHH